MYISRMPLNAVRRGAVELISSPNRMHAAVERAFSPMGEEQSRSGRVLWRIDSSPDDPNVWLYVVSPRRPDFTHVCEQAGWPTTGTWETKDYDRLLERIVDGGTWQFRLKANPSRKVFQDKGSSENARVIGSIQGHVTERQQIEWLLARAEGHGFKVREDAGGNPCLLVSHRGKASFRHGSSRVTLTTAVFDGELEVTDAGLFRAALCHGIGRGKAFGCGLLTIAPIPRQEP